MKRAVVDQAGLRIVIIGLVLSLFLGLIFKSQIRPSVVKSRLQSVLVKLQKDVNIDFESAQVRLSEWGIPRPVVEIRGVRISPIMANCQENQIFIDNLTIPLSFNLLFAQNKIISTVRVSLLEIRLKNTRQCLSKNDNKPATFSEFVPEKIVQSKAAVIDKSDKPNNPVWAKLRNFKSHLDNVKIDRLRIIAIDKLNTAVDFSAVQIQFKYDNEKLSDFYSQAQMLAFKEVDKNYYLLKSDVKIALKLEDDPIFNAELKGSVVDRPFQLKIKNDIQKNSLQFLGELNGVSLKAVNYIVRSERPSTEILEFLSGSSLSGYITGEYFLENKNYNFDFKDIKVLAGNGVAEVNDIHVFGYADQKAQIRPFDVQLSHIDLTKLLTSSLFDNIRPSVQHAGSISGLIQFVNFNDFKVKSLIEKTSFVFSNKGRRVLQVFDSFNFHASIDPDKISLNVNDFILDSQKIKGSIKYTHQIAREQKNLVVDLQGQLLKPDTAELFTGIMQSPDIKLSISTDLKDNLKGSAYIDKLSIHQFVLDNVNLDYAKDILVKKESYTLKTGNLNFRYADSNQNSQLNVFFERLFSKPQVAFNQSRLVVEKDGNGNLSFSVKADQKSRMDINITGDYMVQERNITAKGVYKSSSKPSVNFTLSGSPAKLNFNQQSP